MFLGLRRLRFLSNTGNHERDEVGVRWAAGRIPQFVGDGEALRDAINAPSPSGEGWGEGTVLIDVRSEFASRTPVRRSRLVFGE